MRKKVVNFERVFCPMKKWLFLILCIGMFGSVFAQSKKLQTVQKSIGGGYSLTIFYPTLENMLNLVNASSSEWKNMVSNIGFSPKRGEVGNYYVYTNNGIDFYMYNNDGRGVCDLTFYPSPANSPQRRCVDYFAFKKNIFPYDCISNFYEQLTSYYTKTDGDETYYLLERSGYTYGIVIKNATNSVTIRIQRF